MTFAFRPAFSVHLTLLLTIALGATRSIQGQTASGGGFDELPAQIRDLSLTQGVASRHRITPDLLQFTAQQKPGNVSWWDLTSEGLQSKSDSMRRLGWQHRTISAYVNGGVVQYAATWQQGAPRDQGIWWSMTENEWNRRFEDMRAARYRPVWIDVVMYEDQPRFSAIFVREPSWPAWEIRHSLSSNDLQSLYDRLTASGYRLVHLDAYEVRGSQRYAAIFEQRAGPPTFVRWGMTSQRLQQVFDEQLSRGYQLINITGNRILGEDYYAAIWAQATANAWASRSGLQGAEFLEVSRQYWREGYHTVLLGAFGTDLAPKYYGVWMKP